MDLSDALAQLNVDRYKAWSPTFTDANARPAVLAFNGDVYEGLDAKTLKPKDLQWAQDHVAILSGLYGVSRHQTPGAFGKKTDDFVLPVFKVLEHTFDHPRLQGFAVHRFEILL